MLKMLGRRKRSIWVSLESLLFVVRCPSVLERQVLIGFRCCVSKGQDDSIFAVNDKDEKAR